MDTKLKHLDFIQGVVNRLSTNSFLLKGWSVVLVSALIALAANNPNTGLIFLAYIPAIAFWALDGYFLALERNYRDLYDKIRDKKPEDIDFNMSTADIRRPFPDWQKAVKRPSLIVFHGALLSVILFITLLQLLRVS